MRRRQLAINAFQMLEFRTAEAILSFFPPHKAANLLSMGGESHAAKLLARNDFVLVMSSSSSPTPPTCPAPTASSISTSSSGCAEHKEPLPATAKAPYLRRAIEKYLRSAQPEEDVEMEEEVGAGQVGGVGDDDASNRTIAKS
eukprot:872770-Prorocentrum_minimum.AAC.6